MTLHNTLNISYIKYVTSGKTGRILVDGTWWLILILAGLYMKVADLRELCISEFQLVAILTYLLHMIQKRTRPLSSSIWHLTQLRYKISSFLAIWQLLPTINQPSWWRNALFEQVCINFISSNSRVWAVTTSTFILNLWQIFGFLPFSVLTPTSVVTRVFHCRVWYTMDNRDSSCGCNGGNMSPKLRRVIWWCWGGGCRHVGLMRNVRVWKWVVLSCWVMGPMRLFVSLSGWWWRSQYIRVLIHGGHITPRCLYYKFWWMNLDVIRPKWLLM